MSSRVDTIRRPRVPQTARSSSSVNPPLIIRWWCHLPLWHSVIAIYFSASRPLRSRARAMRSSTFRSSFAACASSTGCAWVKVTNRSPAAPLKLALISRISLRRALRSLSRSISSLLSARFSPRAILRPSRVAKYLSTSSSRPERVIFSKYGIFDSPCGSSHVPPFGRPALCRQPAQPPPAFGRVSSLPGRSIVAEGADRAHRSFRSPLAGRFVRFAAKCPPGTRSPSAPPLAVPPAPPSS